MYAINIWFFSDELPGPNWPGDPPGPKRLVMDLIFHVAGEQNSINSFVDEHAFHYQAMIGEAPYQDWAHYDIDLTEHINNALSLNWRTSTGQIVGPILFAEDTLVIKQLEYLLELKRASAACSIDSLILSYTRALCVTTSTDYTTVVDYTTEIDYATETVYVTETDVVTTSGECTIETITQSSTETVYASIELLSGDNVCCCVGATSGEIRSAGTIPAAWIDSTAGGVLLGMSEDGVFIWDTDADYVDANGHPNSVKVPSGSTFVASGGPVVNGPVKYYELNRGTENTPAYYAYEGGKHKFKKTVDDSVLVSFTPSSTNDLFIIQIFADSEGRNIVLVYGLAGRGTLAGALYFADKADSFKDKEGFWIYEWTDSGTSGVVEHQDPPGTDTYTLVTSG